MKKNSYKIVVLSDMKDATNNSLKSAVGLAKMINGKISVFHVKKPSEVVNSENQLSAMRTINNQYSLADKKMQKLINSFSEASDMNIKYAFTFGNVKNEISNYLEEVQPDIIVLGKRRSKPFNLIGDGITDFVLNEHEGAVMITADKNIFDSSTDMALGTLNGLDPSLNLAFANDVIRHTKSPIKSFKIVKSSGKFKETPTPQDKRTVEFVFEHSDNTIKNLPNYLLGNKINLLFVERGVQDAKHTYKLTPSDISSVMSHLNVTLLITGGKI